MNYEERFNWFGSKVLPDELWVADKYALEIAKNLFPKTIVKLINNPYLSLQKKKYNKLKPNDKNKFALYISENLTGLSIKQPSDLTYQGITDNSAFENFILNKKKCEAFLNIKDSIGIIIRPHPSEDENLYSDIIKKYSSYNIVLSNEESLLQQIKSCSYVAGLSSMAMVVALEMRISVFCVIPSNIKYSHYLPYNEIININSL